MPTEYERQAAEWLRWYASQAAKYDVQKDQRGGWFAFGEGRGVSAQEADRGIAYLAEQSFTRAEVEYAVANCGASSSAKSAFRAAVGRRSWR